MKYIYNILLTGLMVHFLPLSAESAQEDEALSFTTSALIADREEAPLTSLDEELSLLDEEFEEFKEELSSIEEAFQNKDHHLTVIEEQTPLEDAIVEVNPQSDELIYIENVSVNVQTPEESTLISQEDFYVEPEEVMNLVAVEEAPSVVHETARSEAPATLNVQGTSTMGEIVPAKTDAISVDLQQAFSGSPIIYSILLAMSVFSVCIWLYSILSLRSSAHLSAKFIKDVRNKLNSNQIEETLSLCEANNNLFCKMVCTGIQSRRHGLPVMIEAMKAEGKRSTISFWQKIGLLNDIAIIAPMLGLLGTVLGMFYAFYNVNRSIESISILFDGLGISVGTTVAGLVVAILALILHSTAKYRLVRALSYVENEAQSVAVLIDDRTSILKG